MSVTKKPIRAFAVIIDVKEFPRDCTECVFNLKSQCIPQGKNSTISIKGRPKGCPLRTALAYEIEKAGEK